MPPTSLYLHVPFCARRCPYCDFAVSVNGKAEFRAAYLEAMQLELRTQLGAQGARLDTVFCGGGTPTELRVEQLNALLDTVREVAPLADGAEVSLEANPENLTPVALRELRAGGWNRLSLGAQSFDDETLRFLGRAHDGARVEAVVQGAREAEWENISLDLIFGSPFQSLSKWRETLQKAAALRVTHVSAYSLTIEPGTAMGLRLAQGHLRELDDDAQADLMDAADEVLEGAGYVRYEVASWCLPGFECRHNLNYWRGGSYFAVGCGAHGHFDGERFWNERDAKTYIRRVTQSGAARVETERLSSHQRLAERVVTGLRTREGLPLNAEQAALLQPTMDNLCAAGVIVWDGAHLAPTSAGFALADGLARRLVERLL